MEIARNNGICLMEPIEGGILHGVLS